MAEENNNNLPPNDGNGGSDYERISARLGKIKLSLDNASADDVQAVISKNGYDKVEIKVAMDMYEDTYDKHEKQKKEYGEQYAATDEYNAAREKANKEYKKNLGIARVVFKDDRQVKESLMLDGLRHKNYDDWFEQVRVFYKNALNSADIKTALAKRGVTEAVLQDGWKLAEETDAANAKQQNENSEAVKATAVRDAALDALEKWFSDFSNICHAVMEDYPELIRKLGL
jgi:hypothetical protein